VLLTFILMTIKSKNKQRYSKSERNIYEKV